MARILFIPFRKKIKININQSAYEARHLAKPQNVVQQLMTNMSQKEEQFEDYFKFIKILGIDTEENYNEIKEYYSKGLLRFNIS
jgi:hypothetical protein